MHSWSTSGGYIIYQVLAGRSNAFLITDKRKNILVDTGPRFMWNILRKRLDRLQISKIDLLILTHSHFDHAANASRIKEAYKAKVIIHQSEIKFLNTGDNILPAGTNALSGFIIKAFENKFNTLTRYSPCNHDLTFDKSYDLADYGFNAFLMHTPGHTPGSTSIIIDNELALVGDTMFGVFRRTVFPPFASNPDLLIDSWGKLLETGCRIYLPSHGSANKRSLVEKDFARKIFTRKK